MALSIEEQVIELRAMVEIVADNAGLKNRLPSLLPKKVAEIKARMVVAAVPVAAQVEAGQQ